MAIQKSMIYQDALLYNTAAKHGIEVIGVEGKNLKHNKESPEYNSAREGYMVEQINKIISGGRNVVFPVGSIHIDGLKAKIPNSNILDAKLKEQEYRPIPKRVRQILKKFSVTFDERSSYFSSPITPLNKKSSSLKQH